MQICFISQHSLDKIFRNDVEDVKHENEDVTTTVVGSDNTTTFSFCDSPVRSGRVGFYFQHFTVNGVNNVMMIIEVIV